jgi:hypothetical protein
VVLVGLRWPKLPSKLIGVAAGTAVSVVVAYFFHSIDLGPRLPEMSATLPVPDALLPLASAPGLTLAYGYFYEIAIAAAAIAVIASLDSLLAAVGDGRPLDTGHGPTGCSSRSASATSSPPRSAACRSPIRRTTRSPLPTTAGATSCRPSRRSARWCCCCSTASRCCRRSRSPVWPA